MERIEESPLHKAIKENNEVIVLELITRGEDIEKKTKEGYTSLHIAAMRGRISIVKILISKGADIEARDEFGYTPLRIAEICSREVIIQILAKEREKKQQKQSAFFESLVNSSFEVEEKCSKKSHPLI